MFFTLLLGILLSGCDKRSSLVQIAAHLISQDNNANLTGSEDSSSRSPASSTNPTPTPNAKVFFKNPTFGQTQANAYSYSFSTQTKTYSISPSTAINFDAQLVDVVIKGTQNG